MSAASIARIGVHDIVLELQFFSLDHEPFLIFPILICRHFIANQVEVDFDAMYVLQDKNCQVDENFGVYLGRGWHKALT